MEAPMVTFETSAESLGIVVRSGSLDDLPRLQQEVYGSAAAESSDALSDHEMLLVAELHGKLVGAVRLSHRPGWAVPCLGNLAVAESAEAPQKTNAVARLLVSHAENYVQRKGFSQVGLSTPAAHPWIPRFFGQNGYTPKAVVDLQASQVAGPRHEIIMEKRLTPATRTKSGTRRN